MTAVYSRVFVVRGIACLFIGLGIGLPANAEKLDPASAQAQAGAPTAAQVPEVEIARDPAAPTYVLVVEPVVYGASGSDITSGNSAPVAPEPNSSFRRYERKGSNGRYLYRENSSNLEPGSLEGTPTSCARDPRGIEEGLTTEFRSALMRWGNASLADLPSVTRMEDGSVTTKMSPGEVGPFIVRATVTQFTETSDMSSGNRKFSGGVLGGAIPGLGGLGQALALINPTIEKRKSFREGVVKLTVEIVDGRTARGVAGFTCSGTFKTKSETDGFTVFGSGGGDSRFAASALGQATEQALNEALQKTAVALRGRS